MESFGSKEAEWLNQKNRLVLQVEIEIGRCHVLALSAEFQAERARQVVREHWPNQSGAEG